MEKTWKPTVGGILAIISGIVGIIVGLIVFTWGPFAGAWFMAWLGAIVISPLFIISGIIAIVGGMYALQRKIWGLALAGSICALFSSAGILGILAIIFVVLGKREFK
jgi:hypothetical protein